MIEKRQRCRDMHMQVSQIKLWVKLIKKPNKNMTQTSRLHLIIISSSGSRTRKSTVPESSGVGALPGSLIMPHKVLNVFIICHYPTYSSHIWFSGSCQINRFHYCLFSSFASFGDFQPLLTGHIHHVNLFCINTDLF